MQYTYSDNMSEQEKRDYIRNSFDNLFVEAGAGAGKTTFITKRIINHIKAGANPADFVFIAFTGEASAELKRKIEKNIRREIGKVNGTEKDRLENALGNLSDMNIMTICRFCHKLLREAGAHFVCEYDETVLDAHGMDPRTAELVSSALKLLESNPEYLKKCRSTYKHIFVDEFQDTNEEQSRLLHLLVLNDKGDGLRDNSLFILGDEKQSVYGDEGACVDVFFKVRDFMSRLNNAHVISVKNNYRSEFEIIRWVNESFKSVFENYEPMTGEWVIKKSGTFHGVRRAVPVFGYEKYDTAADIKAVMRLLSHFIFDERFMIDDKEGGDARRFSSSDFLIIVMNEDKTDLYKKAARDYNLGDIEVTTVKHSKGLSANVVIVADRSIPAEGDNWRKVEYVEATRPRHALVIMPEIVPGSIFSGENYALGRIPEIRA